MLLDLARYWLMQWHLVVILSLGGLLTKQLFRCIVKQRSPAPVVRISIDYGFQFHYIQKHIGLGPGNNLIAVYFFLFLIVIWSNSILFFTELPTVRYTKQLQNQIITDVVVLRSLTTFWCLSCAWSLIFRMSCGFIFFVALPSIHVSLQ